jgi:hypothetical protein
VHTGKPAGGAQGSRIKTSIDANGWYATIGMSGFGSHKSKDTRQQNWVVSHDYKAHMLVGNEMVRGMSQVSKRRTYTHPIPNDETD